MTVAVTNPALRIAEDITQLIAAFKKRQSGEILMPMVDGQRGNPIVLSGVAINQILASGQNMVCRKFMDEHPEVVNVFHTDNEHFIFDVDSLEDLDVFQAKTGWSLTVSKASNGAAISQPESEPAYLSLQKLRP